MSFHVRACTPPLSSPVVPPCLPKLSFVFQTVSLLHLVSTSSPVSLSPPVFLPPSPLCHSLHTQTHARTLSFRPSLPPRVGKLVTFIDVVEMRLDGSQGPRGPAKNSGLAHKDLPSIRAGRQASRKRRGRGIAQPGDSPSPLAEAQFYAFCAPMSRGYAFCAPMSRGYALCAPVSRR